MSLPMLIFLEGLLFTALFGGLSWLRREGLSIQFAIEALLLTLIAGGLTALTSVLISPVLFLIILYLVTMRVRLLVDMGTLMAQRGQFKQADGLYALAMRLWPDSAGRLIVQVNQGVLRLQQGSNDPAIAIFKDALQKAGQGYLGLKYEAATHYNLAVAYRRKGLDAQATAEFNAVLDTWPVSEYARRAKAALEQGRRKSTPPPDDSSAA